MINKVVLVGRLTKDPELRYTPSGIANARFTVAVNRPFSNQQGEKEADFINCVAWRKQAENLCNYMKKGNLVGVEGRIQTGSFEGQDGKRVYTTDVVIDQIAFLESKNNRQDSAPSYGQQNAPSYGQQSTPPANTQHNQNAPNNYAPNSYGFGGQANAQQNQPSTQQPNYTRVDEDPFANSKAPIEVSEDDLPF